MKRYDQNTCRFGSLVSRLLLSVVLVVGTAFPPQLAFAIDEPLVVEEGTGKTTDPKGQVPDEQGMGTEGLNQRDSANNVVLTQG